MVYKIDNIIFLLASSEILDTIKSDVNKDIEESGDNSEQKSDVSESGTFKRYRRSSSSAVTVTTSDTGAEEASGFHFEGFNIVFDEKSKKWMAN